MRTRPVALALALALIATPALARQTDEAPLRFRAVPDVGPSLGADVPVHVEPRPEVSSLLPDMGGAGLPTRPVVNVPEPVVIVVPVDQSGGRGRSLQRGSASWYCGHGSACTHGYMDGLYAAAGPALRAALGREWRGRRVHVASGLRGVDITLIDWCACPNGRLLDLFSDAFLRLAPLDRGVVKVTVSW
jgi:hypothetical protein